MLPCFVVWEGFAFCGAVSVGGVRDGTFSSSLSTALLLPFIGGRPRGLIYFFFESAECSLTDAFMPPKVCRSNGRRFSVIAQCMVRGTLA